MAQTHVFTSFPESHEDSEDTENLLANDQLQSANLENEEFMQDKKFSVWQIEYYQKFFNVSTNDVIARCVSSAVPTFNRNFLLDKIRPNPDLYGPFWISITLIFTISITGNIANFLANFGAVYNWQTDFHKISASAFVILIYWWVVPCLIYTLMKWRKTQSDFTFLEILCIYGYSLFIYIPVSVLWIVKISALQWLLVLTGASLSGLVLALTFWPALSQDDNKKFALGVVLLMFFLHALLAVSFMMYFFHYPVPDVDPSSLTTTSPSTPSSAAKLATSVITKSVSAALTNASALANATLAGGGLNASNSTLAG